MVLLSTYKQDMTHISFAVVSPSFTAEELEVLEGDCARFASRLGLKSEEGPIGGPWPRSVGSLEQEIYFSIYWE